MYPTDATVKWASHRRKQRKGEDMQHQPLNVPIVTHTTLLLCAHHQGPKWTNLHNFSSTFWKPSLSQVACRFLSNRWPCSLESSSPYRTPGARCSECDMGVAVRDGSEGGTFDAWIFVSVTCFGYLFSNCSPKYVCFLHETVFSSS